MDKEEANKSFEEAKKEEEKLDRMMSNFFNNMSQDKPTEDTNGVEKPLISGETTEADESDPKGTVEEEEEEVFLIHDDGEITSETTESEEDTKEVLMGQSLVDRAIYNRAVNNVYDDIIELQDFLELSVEFEKESTLTSEVVDKIRDSYQKEARHFLQELGLSKFSRFKEVPLDDVVIENIEDEKIKTAVEREVEQVIIELMGGTLWK